MEILRGERDDAEIIGQVIFISSIWRACLESLSHSHRPLLRRSTCKIEQNLNHMMPTGRIVKGPARRIGKTANDGPVIEESRELAPRVAENYAA